MPFSKYFVKYYLHTAKKSFMSDILLKIFLTPNSLILFVYSGELFISQPIKAMTFMFALRPAFMPARESSMTTQFSGSAPIFRAASKNKSGSGFPCSTISAVKRLFFVIYLFQNPIVLSFSILFDKTPPVATHCLSSWHFSISSTSGVASNPSSMTAISRFAHSSQKASVVSRPSLSKFNRLVLSLIPPK